MHLLFVKSTFIFCLKQVSEQSFWELLIDNVDCVVESLTQYLRLVDTPERTSFRALVDKPLNTKFFRFKKNKALQDLNIWGTSSTF